MFTNGNSVDYNGHELSPLLNTSESDLRLWFYDLPTDWLAGIYPSYSRYGYTLAQFGM